MVGDDNIVLGIAACTDVSYEMVQNLSTEKLSV